MSSIETSAAPAQANGQEAGETFRPGARDLQLHLYREIGISAVAAALNCLAIGETQPNDTLRHKPAMLAADSLAA